MSASKAESKCLGLRLPRARPGVQTRDEGIRVKYCGSVGGMEAENGIRTSATLLQALCRLQRGGSPRRAGSTDVHPDVAARSHGAPPASISVAARSLPTLRKTTYTGRVPVALRGGGIPASKLQVATGDNTAARLGAVTTAVRSPETAH